MRVSAVPQVLRAKGLEVIEFDRPVGRGRSMTSIEAIVWHDTVTTQSWSDLRVAQLLRDGRPGVPGPLSQLGETRRGVFYFIADGKCNHNGYGDYGNNAIGIEVFCAGGLKGQEEPYNAIQRRNTAIAAAALSDYYGVPVLRNLGHKETDEERKVDPFDVPMDQMRRDVATAMGGGLIVPGDPGFNEEESMRRGHPNKTSVVYWQKWINLYFHGHSMAKAGCTVDGNFGPETEAYTREFQKRESFTTDGVVELMTAVIMLARLQTKGYYEPAMEALR